VGTVFDVASAPPHSCHIVRPIPWHSSYKGVTPLDFFFFLGICKKKKNYREKVQNANELRDRIVRADRFHV